MLSAFGGITDKLMVGVGRAKRNENLSGIIKYRFLEQTQKIDFVLIDANHLYGPTMRYYQQLTKRLTIQHYGTLRARGFHTI